MIRITPVEALRIVFMGTAALAATVLRTLLDAGSFNVAAVVSQPDKPRGRDLKLQPTPVKEVALQHGLPVLQPLKARDPAFINQLRALQPELIVVAAYGQILPQALLDIPLHGCLNVHTSLLPRHRGAAPIQWAILDGDKETGVTIMKMDAGLDTGAIVSIEKTAITPEDDAQVLHDRLAQLGGALLVRAIPGYVRNEIHPQPQPAEGITYARKITREDGRLDWTQPAIVLWNRVRGLIPWPGTFTNVLRSDGRLMLKVWKALPDDRSGEPGTVLAADAAGIVVASGHGALRILELQREGGRRLVVKQFLAGCLIQPGYRFG